jgi:hypothetical protein
MSGFMENLFKHLDLGESQNFRYFQRKQHIIHGTLIACLPSVMHK